MFWLFAALLVIIALTGFARPLMRRHAGDRARAGQIAALKAELSEIETDRGLRFAGPAEADAARAEVARRLFVLEREATRSGGLSGEAPNWAFVFLALPLLAIPAYLVVGNPDYADQPMISRADTAQPGQTDEIEQIVARVERRLRETPEDGRGWAVIAPVYVRIGRYDDAIIAYRNAVTHFAGTPAERSVLQANHAEVLIGMAEGTVSDDAAALLVKALADDADNQKALFFNGIALEQRGTPEAARANWEALIARFAADNPPWLDLARQRIGQAVAASKGPAQPGPSADDVAAAADMSAEDRQAMISGMVDKLATRLAEQPDDVEGWLRLIQAYSVMGRMDDAKQAIVKAGETFAPGTEKRARIDDIAKSLNIATDG